MRRSLPLAIGFVVGIIMLGEYFFNNAFLNSLGAELNNWRIILVAFSMGLGAVNLLRVHGRTIVRKDKNWDASVLMLISLVGFTTMGIIAGPNSTMYNWCWNNIYQPAYSGVAALLAFMITSASYRAFRVKEWQSFLLMVAAVIVMLGQVGIGMVVYEGIPQWSRWIMAVPNAAGMRGITIGGALGAIALSLRVILGLERGYLGGGD